MSALVTEAKNRTNQRSKKTPNACPANQLCGTEERRACKNDLPRAPVPKAKKNRSDATAPSARDRESTLQCHTHFT